MFPAADAENVPVNTTIVVTFSEPMVRATVEAAFTLTATIYTLPGYFNWTDGNNTQVCVRVRARVFLFASYAPR